MYVAKSKSDVCVCVCACVAVRKSRTVVRWSVNPPGHPRRYLRATTGGATRFQFGGRVSTSAMCWGSLPKRIGEHEHDQGGG